MSVLTDQEFNDLTSFVKVNYGIDLTTKRVFVELRIQKLMAESGHQTFSDYFAFVYNDLTGIAVSNLISGLTVNYTLFNREAYHFEFLANEVLPELYVKTQKTHDLRIWSAGCSTGEEPYTLAIIISDFLGVHKSQWDMKILATDISTFALKKAIEGAYPAASIDGLNPEWVRKYFIKDPADPETVHIAPAIKEEVIFRKQNLVNDPFIFKQKFHVIFCRNVMIYFDDDTKYRLIRKFTSYLDEGGYLFIGMSETIDPAQTGLSYVAPSIYRKSGG